MKKFVSIFCTVVMVLSMVIPCAAAQESPISDTCLMWLDEGVYIEAEDYSNGDASISLVQDGNTIYNTYVKRASGEVISSDYVSNTVTTEFVDVASSQMSPFALNRFSTEGYATYDWYIGDSTSPSGTRRIRFESMKKNEVIEHYDLYGSYQNIANFAGAIVAALSVGSAYAVEVMAPKLLGWLGVASFMAPFVIGHKYVTLNKTEMSWRFSDATVSDYSQTLVGYQYSYSLDNHTQTDYQGYWWPENSYSSHNTTFAYRAYTTLWGTDTQAVLRTWA